MPTAKELIAHGRSHDEICREIGADWLIYQDLKDLIAASTEGNKRVTRFDCSVFNGEYITGDVDQVYLDKLEATRNDSAKNKSGKKAGKAEDTLIGLHNDAVH
jgi:amidophosphoribosyltransferase